MPRSIPADASTRPSTSRSMVARLRLALLLLVAFGMAGTAAELLLIGHYEDVWQLVPLILLGLGLITLAWHALRPGRVRRRALQGVMSLLAVSGGVGTLMHYLGNAEFERERMPAITGLALFRESITGATPALAPGTMVLLGALGLLYAYAAREESPP